MDTARHYDQQPLASSPEQRDGPKDAAHRRRFQIGDAIPGTCTVADVAWVMELSESQVYRLTAAGKLDAFLLASIGGARRYNGRVLKAWSEGTLDQTHINGDLRKPRKAFRPKAPISLRSFVR